MESRLSDGDMRKWEFRAGRAPLRHIDRLDGLYRPVGRYLRDAVNVLLNSNLYLDEPMSARTIAMARRLTPFEALAVVLTVLSDLREVQYGVGDVGQIRDSRVD